MSGDEITAVGVSVSPSVDFTIIIIFTKNETQFVAHPTPLTRKHTHAHTQLKNTIESLFSVHHLDSVSFYVQFLLFSL